MSLIYTLLKFRNVLIHTEGKPSPLPEAFEVSFGLKRNKVVKGDYRAGNQSDCRKKSRDRLSTNQIAVYLICIFKMAR